MESRRLKTITATVVVAIFSIASATSRNLGAEPTTCGDFNNDGVVNITDLTGEMDYLFMGGPPPTDFDLADFDGFKFLTIADAQDLINCIFMCDFTPWGNCPPGTTALTATIDPTIKLQYPNRTQSGVTSFELPLSLINAPSYSAFSAPLSITLNGAPAIIDSITFPAPGSVTESSIALSSNPAPGIASLGLISVANTNLSSYDTPAIIHLSVPFSPSQSTIEVNWTTLSPEQAPTADSSIYPLFHRETFEGDFVPTLQGTCCIVAGDANDDGSFNIADVTYKLARIFAGGPAPICSQSSDSNADGTFNIADLTYNIAYIFAGGAAPMCGPPS